ncbi:MAG: hypothetical protein LBT30_05420 [Clostridiales bacterium]|jgi:hypothetical protein|nr:hypothetical protein [Clostridiales bacterium]
MEHDVLKWIKIDNSARIYPMIYSENGQNIFRIAFEMNGAVDPVILHRAVRDVLPRYPSFKVRMKKGLFWYFFEENATLPVIFKDKDVRLDKIDFHANNNYIFRVCYHKNVISLDFNHTVTDGKGGVEFTKAVIFRYLEISGYKVCGEGLIKALDAPPSGGEIEDSFLNNYKRVPIKDIELGDILGKKGYSINGAPLEDAAIGIINGHCSVASVKAAAKKYGATVTEYLCGLFMYSIYMTNNNAKKRPIKLLIPINLRKIFNSETLRNFSFITTAIAEVKEPSLKFDYFIECVKARLANAVDPSAISKKVAGMVKLDKNMFIKLIPLPLKFIIFRSGKKIISTFRSSTAILTNPGVIDIPESMKPYVRHINMALIPTQNATLNCAVISCKDEISITFARRCNDVDIIRFFFSVMTGEGADLTLTSNYAELKDFSGATAKTKGSGENEPLL